MSFTDLLDQAKAARVREHRDITVLLNGKPIVIRVHEMPSHDWAALTTKHSPRKGVNVDRLGYNVTAASIDAVGVSATVVGKAGAEEKITPEQWQTLLDLLSGAEVSELADAAFALNDWLPRNRIVEAKKGSAGGSKTSSSSPANSASRSVASTAGSRRPSRRTSTTKKDA